MLGSLTGLFGLRKYITRSQTSNALRYSPLVLQNRAMIGGFPARKLDNGFIQTLVNKVAKWTKEAKDGIPLYIDELSYKFNPNNFFKPEGNFKWF